MRLTVLLTVWVLLGSCDNKPVVLPDCLSSESGFAPDNCPGVGDCTFKFYPDSKLQITDDSLDSWMEVIAGEYMVFHFNYLKRDNPMIMDDEYNESVWFQVKPQGDSFLITTDELNSAGALFGRMCFCPDAGYHRMTSGCIYGYRRSDRTWNVSFRLSAATRTATFERMKQHDFLLQLQGHD